MTDLRKLAQTCEFGTIRDSLNRDRLVLGLRDHRVTKRFLSAGDPNLDKALEICRSEEMAVAQTKRIDDVERKANVDEVVTARDEDDLETISAVQRQQDSRQSGKKECTRCGRKHAFRKCPAWGKTCLKCQGTNHFAHMCRTKTVNSVVQEKGCEQKGNLKDAIQPQKETRERAQVTTAEKQQSDDTATTRKQGTKLETTQEGPIYQLGTIKDAESNEDDWRVMAQTNGTEVMFKVDTGAEASILPKTVYNRLRHKPKLLASNARIITYGAKESIPVDGQCICQVTLENGTTRHLRFLVVPFDEEPLLGLRATRHMD